MKGKSNKRNFKENKGSRNSQRGSRNNHSNRVDYDKDVPKNDPAWYTAQFPELTDIASQLSWNVSLGAPISIDPNAQSPSEFASWNPQKEAGFFTIGYVPTLGVSDDWGDPVNKCAIELYSQYRFNKSGNPGYDPADIIQMLIAADSIYQYLGCLIRVYGLLNIATPTNNYLPRYFIEAMGFDYNDLLLHKADLCYHINSMIVQMAKINVPIGMQVFTRHSFLTTNIFKDEPIDRSSDFAFMPEILWQYDEVNAKVIPVEFYKNHTASGSRWQYSALAQLGWSLLDAIQLVDDFYTMNANALAAYDYTGLFTISAIDPMYITVPVFRQEMLIQLHNATFIGYDWDPNSMIIEQDMTQGSPTLGCVKFTPQFTVENPGSGYEQLIDIPFDHPSKDDIMEASRLKVSSVLEATATPLTYTAKLITCGTEIPTRFRAAYFTYYPNTPGQTNTWSVRYQTLLDRGEVQPLDYVINLTKLNMAPQLVHFDVHTVGGNNVVIPRYVMGDLTNFAVVSNDNLLNMHTAALFNLLAISRGILKDAK